MFADEDLKDAEKHPVLGPAYFDARRISRGILEKFEAEDFKPLIDKVAGEIHTKLWSDVESYLLSDTECNVQGEMYRMVDNCVEALLTGKEWALQRYALTGNFDGEIIRKKILEHAPEELKAGRISDLEKEVESLKKDLEYYKRRDYR